MTRKLNSQAMAINWKSAAFNLRMKNSASARMCRWLFWKSRRSYQRSRRFPLFRKTLIISGLNKRPGYTEYLFLEEPSLPHNAMRLSITDGVLYVERGKDTPPLYVGDKKVTKASNRFRRYVYDGGRANESRAERPVAVVF